MRIWLRVTCLLACPLSLCHGELIERDWLSPGDGLLTLDTSTGLEWLDVTETLLDDFPPAGFLEDRYQNVVNETLPGGRFEGFSVASSAEAEQLALSAGIVPGTTSFATNQASTQLLIELLGPLVGDPQSGSTGGVVDEVAEVIPGQLQRVTLLARRLPDTGPSGRAESLIGPGYTLGQAVAPGTDGPIAVLLRRAVPEPNAFVSLTLTVAFLPRTRWGSPGS